MSNIQLLDKIWFVVRLLVLPHHGKQFSINPQRIRQIRKMADEEKIKQAERNLGKERVQEITKEIEQEKQPYQGRDSSGSFLDAFIKNLILEAQKANQRAVQEHQKAQQREEQRSKSRDR